MEAPSPASEASPELACDAERGGRALAWLCEDDGDRLVAGSCSLLCPAIPWCSAL